MHTAIRPWTTTGIALVGASVIAVAPIMPVTAPPEPAVAVAKAPAVTMADVRLTATIADILEFPALRQYIINEVGDFLIQLGGLAGAGAGLGRVIASVPETLRVLTQQLFSLDLTGALTTIETALVGGFLEVAVPIIESRALIQEREAAIFGALATAGPEALLGAGAAIVGAIDAVLRASIIGGQQVVDAILTFDLGNIVGALVDATGDFFRSFGTAGQILIDGIVFVQQTIAEALAAQPPAAPPVAPADDAASVTSVPAPDAGEATVVTLSTQDAADTGEFEAAETAEQAPSPVEQAPAVDEAADEDEAQDETDATDESDDTGSSTTEQQIGDEETEPVQESVSDVDAVDTAGDAEDAVGDEDQDSDDSGDADSESAA